MGESSLVKNFPSKSLITFTYEGNIRAADTLLWEALTRCTNLKTLHWFSSGGPEKYRTNSYRWMEGENSALANCRLEEFSFSICLGPEIEILVDKTFERMLCQVKRLHIAGGLTRMKVIDILDAAKCHVEELTISRLGYARRGTPGDEKAELFLNKLKSISILDAKFGNLSIKAPRTTRVHFGHGKVVDWTLLDSCRNEIKSLYICFKGMENDGEFGQKIFDMPHLEDLVLDFGADNTEWTITEFWIPISGESSNKDEELMQEILPNLKKLKIVNDSTLSPAEVANFVEVRRHLGLTPLESLTVHLASKFADSDFTRLEQLCTVMPGFSFECLGLSKDAN